jgi:hypothetical protein
MARDFREREAAFVSFFAHEGGTLPQADALLSQARRGLGDHAYWSAISHLCRGYFREGLDLLAYCLVHRPSLAVLPPLAWLFRMDRPFTRVVRVLGEALGRLRRKGGFPPISGVGGAA